MSKRPGLPLIVLSLAATLAACIEAPDGGDDPELGADEQAIEDGEQATTFDRARAAKLGNCTATKIDARHVITALHCHPEAGQFVRFYGSTNFPTGVVREIEKVGSRPGTKWDDEDEDWTDSDNKFADIAILRLDAAVPGVVATMAWYYPGPDDPGHKVGAGQHHDDPALEGLLLRKDDETFSGDDNGGGFMTSEFALNDGDSGGAFYDGNRLLGVTNGALLIGVWRGRYTSVAEHLDWILDVINFAWDGDAVQARARFGSLIGPAFYGSQLRCQYACTETPNCAAYNWQVAPRICQLLSSVTSSASSTAFRSATR